MNAIKLFGAAAVIVLTSTALHAASDYLMEIDGLKGKVVPAPKPKPTPLPRAVLVPQNPTPGLLLPAVQAVQPAAAPGAVVAPKSAAPALLASAAHVAKPATCGQGYTAIGLKLQKHEGKAWYEYQCVAEQQVDRTCNSDTSVTAVKDEFVSLPSDEQSHKSKLLMSYKCFHYVPVK